MSTVSLRAASSADASAIAAIYAPYVTRTAVSFEEIPPTSEAMANRMAASPQLPWWVAVDGGTIVGYAYATPHRRRAAYRWSVEVSVYLASSRRGRGLGTALYRGLLPEVRGRGYVSAYAGITLPNAPSVGLHENVGFAPVGVFPSVGFKLGRWHDVGWWHLPLVDPPVVPVDPRPQRSPAVG
ncbi:MAG: arsinothricin resistance N-acetyltransferase ArsN1 family B [Jatrophihabitans sp.]